MYPYSSPNYKYKRLFLFTTLICIITVFFTLCYKPGNNWRWNKKYNLIGHAAMDSLWKIEKQFDIDPASVPETDIEKYSKAMEKMVGEVITGKRDSDIFEIKRVSYGDTFSKFIK